VKIGSILPNKWYVIEFTSGLHEYFTKEAVDKYCKNNNSAACDKIK